MQKPNSQRREQQLKRLISTKKRHLDNAPAGYLRIATIGKQFQYYHVQPGARNAGTYLSKKKELRLIRQLAQKAYDAKVLRAAEQELRAWQALANFFPDKTVEEVYDTLSPARQKLVTPIRLTDEEYRQQWEAVSYEPGYFKPDTPLYKTDRGERVRSKSELLIANLLYRLGIPYRYEYPTTIIVNGRPTTWRPDFLILDVKNRREFYLEHLGRLGEAEYAKNAFEKMKIYEENGMHEGTNMLYSFETNDVPLDLQLVEMKVLRKLNSQGDSPLRTAKPPPSSGNTIKSKRNTYDKANGIYFFKYCLSK